MSAKAEVYRSEAPFLVSPRCTAAVYVSGTAEIEAPGEVGDKGHYQWYGAGMTDASGGGGEPTLVTSDGLISGTLAGDVVVFAGAVFELDGTVTGNLIVEFGGSAIVRGAVGGSIRNRGGHVHLLGAAGGVVDAAPGAVTVIEPGAVIKARKP